MNIFHTFFVFLKKITKFSFFKYGDGMEFFTSKNKLKFFSVFSTLLFITISFPAFAEINNGDTAWILTSTALVLFMTLPGLALFYAGLVN